jgi:Reverse transcriptase (RNA-dependent DNA polymerase).
MSEEIKSLEEHDVWDLVEKPKDRKIIGTKWVFKLKRDEHGNPVRYKARLVAQGYSQQLGLD